MKRFQPWLLVPVALGLLGTSAHAHFIWIHVFERLGTRVEVLFGDGVYQDSDPSLVRYVEGLEARIPGGEPLGLESHGWGLSAELPAGANLVAATRDMGVFDRPGPGSAVKLDYYAKGALDVGAAGRAVGTRAEVLLLPDGDAFVLRVLFDGEPAPGAQVVVPHEGAVLTETLETDGRGEVRVPRPSSGLYSVRARVEVPEAGDLDGTEYTAQHHWATLTVSSVRGTPPPGGGAAAAWLRLEAVEAARYRLPPRLAGLAGTLAVRDGDGERRRGEFSVVDGAVAQCTLEGASEGELAELCGELLDLVESLRSRPFDEALGRYAVSWSQRDGHPLGHELRVADPAQTVVRVEEERLRSVERTSGGRRIVETVLAEETTKGGRVLPTHTVRSTFDERTGDLLSTSARTDAFDEVDGLHLPVSRRVVFAASADEAGGRGWRVLDVELRNLELLEGGAVDAAPVDAGAPAGGR